MPKTIKLKAAHYLIMKIPIKRESELITSNYLSYTDFKDLTKLYKDYSKERFSLIVNDTILPIR